MKRAVFFDRDGVLNEAGVRDGVPHPPQSLAELRFVPGARQAVAAVREAGFVAIAITNQPDVARGHASQAGVEAIDEAVIATLGLDALYACFHDDADACDCRKPKPGLVRQAAAEHGIDLAASYFVGDRSKDVACGNAAGCVTIFIDRKYGETPAETGAWRTVATLDEAISQILQREGALH